MTNKKINKFICLVLTILVFCSQMFGCGDGVGARYRSFEMENGGYKTTVVFDTKNPIIKNGKTDYVIIVGNKATETEKYAAEELSSYLEQITGVKVPVYSEKFVKNATTTMKLISVGHTDLKNRTLNYDTVDFNNDGFVIKTVDSTLFLFGGESRRGTLYAVYDYLENCQGCRFYLPEVEKVPKVKNVYLPVMDLVEIPTFALREVVYNTMYSGDFSVKSRLTSERDILEEESYEKFGEIHSDFFWNHAHNIESTIVPRTIYGDSHPEWYYYDSNVGLYNFDYTYGVKDDGTYDDTMQINPVDIAVETLKGALLESDAYYLNCSQQDTGDCCTNPIYLTRKEVIQSSGVILQFLNLVCEKLDEWIETAVDENGDKLFPNGRPYQILNFAYSHTQTPPINSNKEVAVKAHKNILTWLAPIEFNGLYTYYDTENQITYVPGLFTGWEKCVESFGVWDYYSNFVNMCMNYSYYISIAQGNYRYYADLGCVNYVFSEFIGASDWHRNEFDELKTYCSSKLMWDPYRYTMDALVKEYCNYVFGAQGEDVLKVITAMEDNFAIVAKNNPGYRLNHSAAWAECIPLSLIEDNLEILDNAIAENAKSNEPISVKERIDLRLKKFKITISSHKLFEYDSYYPVVDINNKKAFHDEFYGLIEETNFNEYFGKWTNANYDHLLSFRVT